jgi:hypothetical protein
VEEQSMENEGLAAGAKGKSEIWRNYNDIEKETL